MESADLMSGFLLCGLMDFITPSLLRPLTLTSTSRNV